MSTVFNFCLSGADILCCCAVSFWNIFVSKGFCCVSAGIWWIPDEHSLQLSPKVNVVCSNNRQQSPFKSCAIQNDLNYPKLWVIFTFKRPLNEKLPYFRQKEKCFLRLKEVEMVFVLFFLLGSVQLQVCHLTSCLMTFYKQDLLVSDYFVGMYAKLYILELNYWNISFRIPQQPWLQQAMKQTRT